MTSVLRSSLRIAAIIAFLVAPGLSTRLCAQKATLWGNLEPGPYAVGFKTIYRYDYSRNWKPKYDSDKRLQRGVRARPMRISVWYPAKNQVTGRKMSYQGYVHFDNKDVVFAELNRELERRNVASLRQVLKGEPAFRGLMAAQMAAVLNAAPQNGAFPLVAYSPGLNESWQHANAVLSEYLASHGYVVVTPAQLGTTSLRLNLGINPIDMETQVRDLEFAIGVMQDFQNVDHNKLVIVGHSMGGVAALILKLRNSEVDAVVGLDASYGSPGRLGETLTKSPYYKPERMRTPLLDLRRVNSNLDLRGIDAFRYSNRYYLQFVGIQHSDFTSFPMIATRFPTDIEGRTPEAASRGYHLVCRYVLNFLNAVLKNDERGLSFINRKPEENGTQVGLVKFDLRKGLPAPPSEEEFVQIIRREGLQKAILTFREFKAKEPNQPIISESVLTSLGYDFISPPDPQPALAIDIFKLIVEAHPTSADAYDSLAEGYIAHGDKDMAIKSYEKVLEVVATDPTANEEKKKSLRNNALEKLKELRR